MFIADAHCDLPTKVLDLGQHLTENQCRWSLDRLPVFPFLQVFACWIDQATCQTPFQRAKEMIRTFSHELAGYPEQVLFARSAPEIEESLQGKKLCALLSIEGGEALEGDLSHLQAFYEMGVRILTLTWNYENEIGTGAAAGPANRGLTAFGRQTIAEMNRLRMVIDVSHLNDAGFDDVSMISQRPFWASHSNCRSLCGNPRNLTDEQITFLIRSGGLVGVNLYPPFLSDRGEAGLKDVLCHVEHFLSLGGENTLMLGCDFDGFDQQPAVGLGSVAALGLFFEEMAKLNYPDKLIAKIAGENLSHWLIRWL